MPQSDSRDSIYIAYVVWLLLQGAPTPIVTLTDKSCNTLYWSPRGEQIVLAGMQVC